MHELNRFTYTRIGAGLKMTFDANGYMYVACSKHLLPTPRYTCTLVGFKSQGEYEKPTCTYTYT